MKFASGRASTFIEMIYLPLEIEWLIDACSYLLSFDYILPAVFVLSIIHKDIEGKFTKRVWTQCDLKRIEIYACDPVIKLYIHREMLELDNISCACQAIAKLDKSINCSMALNRIASIQLSQNVGSVMVGFLCCCPRIYIYSAPYGDLRNVNQTIHVSGTEHPSMLCLRPVLGNRSIIVIIQVTIMMFLAPCVARS